MIRIFNRRNGRHAGAVYIGRPSLLGNPYSHMPNTTAQFHVRSREVAVERYGVYAWERMQRDQTFRDALLACEDGAVECWCAPLLCHGNTFDALIARWRRENP